MLVERLASRYSQFTRYAGHEAGQSRVAGRFRRHGKLCPKPILS